MTAPSTALHADVLQEGVRKVDPSRAHFGDPCVFCDVGHDDIAPGPCPKNNGKPRVVGYLLMESRWDGYQRYRFRTTLGKVHEVWSHPSYHAPYYHFGRSDDFVNPPPVDLGLQTATVTA